MKRSRMGRTRTLVALVVMSLATAACGGGQGDDRDGSGTGEREAVVSLGITSWHTFYWWLMAARDEGLMEPYGVKLDVVTFQNTGQIAAGVLSGSVDIGLFAPEQAFTIQDKTPDLMMIGSNISKSPYTLLGAPNVQSIEDLKGGTIGVTSEGSSADYFTILLMLKSHGMEKGKDFTFVNAGPPSQRAAAMLKGQLAAVANFEPDALKLIAEGAHVLDRASEYDDLNAIEANVFAARKSWYDKDRDVAVRFMRGVLASIEWLYDPANRERAEQLLADEMGLSAEDADATYERMVLELQPWDRDGKVDPQRLEQERGNAVVAGVSGMPDADDLDWRYDNSLLEEAARDSK